MKTMITSLRAQLLHRAPLVAALLSLVSCTPAQRAALKSAGTTAIAVAADCTSSAWDAGSKIAGLVHQGGSGWESSALNILAAVPAFVSAADCIVKAIEAHMAAHAVDCAGDTCVAAEASPQLQAEQLRYRRAKLAVHILAHGADQ
jgi:hypothetical protein